MLQHYCQKMKLQLLDISGSQTQFGFEIVDITNKEPQVKQVFGNVPDLYNVMHDSILTEIPR